MNISKRAIGAGAKGMYLRYNSVRPSPAWEELPENTRMVYREQFTAGLTAALEHIIPKESDHAMFSVFDTAYGERDTHAWQNRVFRGLTAVLSHLRGEGKQAEASTPPVVKERLTTEPNPDDVERLARAMFEQHGRKCSWKVGWDGQEEGTKDAYREQAAAAIVAMNGQLLGVWWKQGKAEGWWHGKNGKPVNTSDKVLLDEFVYTLARELSAAGAKTTFEVRPYTAPREKPATQLIAENIVIKHNCQHVPGLAESIAESLESEKRGTAKCG